MDEGVGGLGNITGASELFDSWRGIRRPESQYGDYSISGLNALTMTSTDELLTSGMRWAGVYDESRPAYTQTIGWKLAEILPSWLQ
jgi:hypothetical protein